MLTDILPLNEKEFQYFKKELVKQDKKFEVLVWTGSKEDLERQIISVTKKKKEVLDQAVDNRLDKDSILIAMQNYLRDELNKGELDVHEVTGLPILRNFVFFAINRVARFIAFSIVLLLLMYILVQTHMIWLFFLIAFLLSLVEFWQHNIGKFLVWFGIIDDDQNDYSYEEEE
jgi:hypothetical protein